MRAAESPVQLAAMTLTAKRLLMKLCAARSRYPKARRLSDLDIDDTAATFRYRLRRAKARQARRRYDHYLLRSDVRTLDRRTESSLPVGLHLLA